MACRAHFQGMLDRPLLLGVAAAGTPWFMGLPEDSLSVPLDGGLFWAIPTLMGAGASGGTAIGAGTKLGVILGGADAGSCAAAAAWCFGAFFFSATVLKVPTTT